MNNDKIIERIKELVDKIDRTPEETKELEKLVAEAKEKKIPQPENK